MRNVRAAVSTAIATSLFCLLPLGIITAQAVASAQPAIALPSAVNYRYKNCTALQKKYPHGVGKSNAKDKSSSKKVSTFRRSTSLYNKIIARNRGLDGIACEKR